jgi:hypothetical protein
MSCDVRSMRDSGNELREDPPFAEIAKAAAPGAPLLREVRFSGGMLRSRLAMFCPECRAEYRPGFTSCSDCNVPLVEHLSATHNDADDDRVPGVALLKELGPIIAIPLVGVTLSLFAALSKNPFQIQIATLLGHTGFVLLFVFCDTRNWKGYSLANKAVRQKLPPLVCIHTGFLVVIFAGVTGAIWLRPHTWFLWRLDTDYFD